MMLGPPDIVAFWAFFGLGVFIYRKAKRERPPVPQRAELDSGRMARALRRAAGGRR